MKPKQTTTKPKGDAPMQKNIDITALIETYHLTEEKLKHMTLLEAIQLLDQKDSNDKQKAIQERKNDPNYLKDLKTYFRPYSALCSIWPEETVQKVCIEELSPHDITGEHKMVIPKGDPLYNPPKLYGMEYIKTAYTFVNNGDDFIHRNCYIYKCANPHQGSRHGTIILRLLYETWPQLKPFAFSAYEMTNLESYEIYTKSHLFVPFLALIKGDTEAIRKRNRDYAKSYNNGFFTPKNIETLLKSKETKQFFQTIETMDRKGICV